MNEQKQPQEGKPLGAAEMINEYMKSHKDELYLNDCKKLMEQYAAQQTAALREELERSKDRVDYFREAADKKDVTIENIEKKLESQKKKFKSALADRDQIMRQLYKNESAKLKEELEAMKKERDQLIDQNNKEWAATLSCANRKLEAAEKEISEFNSKMMELMIHHEKQLSEVTRQRDEAVNLLREYGLVKSQKEETEWHRKYIDLLSRLSSGETKPASPWISIEERLPELTEPATWFNGETGLRESYRENDHATVWAYNPEMGAFKAEFSGKRWVEKSSTSIRGDVKPTHWMPIPAPPESLT